MGAASAGDADSSLRATQYRRRYQARAMRLVREETERAAELATRKAALDAGASGNGVLAAIARAKAKKSGVGTP